MCEMVESLILRASIYVGGLQYSINIYGGVRSMLAFAMIYFVNLKLTEKYSSIQALLFTRI